MLQEPSPNASDKPEYPVPPPPPPPSSPSLPPPPPRTQGPPPPPKDNKTRNYFLAVIVSVIIVCIALMAVARSLESEIEQRDRDATNFYESFREDPLVSEARLLRLTTSDYPIGSFTEAAQALGIEPVDEWQTFAHGNVNIRLPHSMYQLTEAELDALAQQGAMDSDDLDGLFAAMDDSSITTGLNILIQSIPTTSDMFPALYVVGVGAEVRANGLTIKDMAAYAVNGREIGRLIYERRGTDTSFSVVQYAYVPYKKTVLLITISCTSDSFDMWLPVFEAIAHNVTVN